MQNYVCVFAIIELIAFRLHIDSFIGLCVHAIICTCVFIVTCVCLCYFDVYLFN